jgi:hypothetical protein
MMLMLDQLEVIKSILRTPGEVFYGSISEDGIVSQDIADAEPDIKWLVAEVERLRVENEYHEKRAIRLAAENDLLKVSLKQADSKRAAEIINDHFKGGEW